MHRVWMVNFGGKRRLGNELGVTDGQMKTPLEETEFNKNELL